MRLTRWFSGASYAPHFLWYRFALFTIKNAPLHWPTDHGVRQENYEKYSMGSYLVFDERWMESNRNTKDCWIQDVLDEYLDSGKAYLDCLSGWYNELPGTVKEKSTLLASLKSPENSAHLGAVNEIFWWKLSLSMGFKCDPIKRGKIRTPDFIEEYLGCKAIFEVTTLNPAEKDIYQELEKSNQKSIHRIFGKAADDKLEQFKYAYNMKLPAIFVLFNYNEWTGFGSRFDLYMKNSEIFKNMPPELSSIVYVERKVLGGKPSLGVLSIMDNPTAFYKFPEEMKNRLQAANSWAIEAKDA